MGFGSGSKRRRLFMSDVNPLNLSVRELRP